MIEHAQTTFAGSMNNSNFADCFGSISNDRDQTSLLMTDNTPLDRQKTEYLVILKKKTRAVRGSDYSPAIVLSEEKDKFVTENWRERKMDQ